MLNRCEFIGRLGRDPETKYTQSGQAVASFSVACSETWKDKNGDRQEKTEWINCTAWGKLGEICGQYLQKGSLVYVAGKLQTRKWQDQEGKDRYATDIVLSEMKMLSGRQDREEYTGPPSAGDDVPFN